MGGGREMSEVNQDRCHSVAVGHVTPLTNTICNYTAGASQWKRKTGKRRKERIQV